MTKITGIDISKQTFDCSITAEDGKITHLKAGNNPEGFENLRKRLPEGAQVVMEASGPYYYRLAFYLFEKGIAVSVVNPLAIRRFCQMRMIRTKTDKKDAEMIRQYGVTEQPSLWQPDEKAISRLKQLNTVIELMDKNCTAYSNQLEALEQMPDADKAVLRDLKGMIRQTEKMRDKLHQEMESTVLEHYNDTYHALQTIKGIGSKTAAMLIAITGNFKKFNHYRQLVAYVGLNPRVFESGTSVKGRGHISKMGTARLRKLLYLCSWSAKRSNVYCKEMYERMKAKGKPEKVIKIAIANKLLRQAFAIGTTLKPFENNYAGTVAF